MKRLLYISAYYPSADVPAAGNRLAAHRLSALCERYDSVHAITFVNALERLARPSLPDHANLFESRYRIGSLNRVAAIAAHPLTPMGAAVRRHLGRRQAVALLREFAFDAIAVEFTQAIEVLPPPVWHRATLHAHDLLAQLYDRGSAARGWRGWLARLERRKSMAWEERVFRTIGTLTVLSDKDRDLISSLYGVDTATTEPPRHFYRVTGRTADTVIPNTILFWANYARSENADGAAFFIDAILPLIQREIPQIRVIMAGAHPPIWSRNSPSSVEWTGFVDSPDALFQTSQIGIVPLRSGAGVKIKTLEFLAAGIPTVATPVGAEGVEGNPLLHIEQDAATFARRCVELIKGEAAR
jgi:hypothetical protein